MSNPRYDWWGYVKGMIRRYPKLNANSKGNEEKEREAVSNAIDQTMDEPDGNEQIKLIDLVFWKKTHTIAGAALLIHCSERTARRWHTKFIRKVAKNYGLID